MHCLILISILEKYLTAEKYFHLLSIFPIMENKTISKTISFSYYFAKGI